MQLLTLITQANFIKFLPTCLFYKILKMQMHFLSCYQLVSIILRTSEALCQNYLSVSIIKCSEDERPAIRPFKRVLPKPSLS